MKKTVFEISSSNYAAVASSPAAAADLIRKNFKAKDGEKEIEKFSRWAVGRPANGETMKLAFEKGSVTILCRIKEILRQRKDNLYN